MSFIKLKCEYCGKPYRRKLRVEVEAYQMYAYWHDGLGRFNATHYVPVDNESFKGVLEYDPEED